ncbi:MAG: aminoacyl-tRNA hydrolase [Anaerolineaceae bacterium]
MDIIREPYLIVGLGNPGQAYKNTRHNFGFLAVDAFAKSHEVTLKRIKFKAIIGEGKLCQQPYILAKPLTFMNNSGSSVSRLIKFFKVSLDHLIIIHDDLDLPLGTLRIRQSGGAAGQRGMSSIIDQLGTQQFPRIRLGISRPPGQMDPVDYVLRKFTSTEETLRDMVLKQTCESLETILKDGVTAAMNRHNGEVG